MIKKQDFLNKKLIITIFFFLLLTTLLTPPIVIAQETNTEIRNQIIQENIRTRTEIKAYFDKKQKEFEQYAQTTGKKFIDDNFRVFDNRMRKLATKMLIKLIIATISCILIAQILWYLIKKRIQKKHLPKPTELKTDGLSPKTARFNIPNQPTITELPRFPPEELQKPTKKEQKIIEQERKKQEKIRKKFLKKINKRKKQARKKQEKIRKKISKPETKEKKLIEEINKLNNIEEKLDKKEKDNAIPK